MGGDGVKSHQVTATLQCELGNKSSQVCKEEWSYKKAPGLNRTLWTLATMRWKHKQVSMSI